MVLSGSMPYCALTTAVVRFMTAMPGSAPGKCSCSVSCTGVPGLGVELSQLKTSLVAAMAGVRVAKDRVAEVGGGPGDTAGPPDPCGPNAPIF